MDFYCVIVNDDPLVTNSPGNLFCVNPLSVAIGLDVMKIVTENLQDKLIHMIL